jgi:pyruvate decarboxylase
VQCSIVLSCLPHHHPPAHRIQNWDYLGLVKALQHHAPGSTSTLFVARVQTEGEFAAALSAALSAEHAQHLAFIEVVIDTDDVSKELLEFGARVAAANSRPPNPQ